MNVLLLGTRKGLLMLERGSGGWRIARTAFLGAPVPYAMEDPRTGTFWASIDHGHWGQKLHRSRDRGVTWEEVTAPKYPEGAELGDGKPASLNYLWVLAPGGADQPGRMYAGTEPGALFVSDDDGDSFAMVDSLWNHPSRTTQWFGGGRDNPGIHSIIVDPRDSRRVQIGISCAGVFETADGGTTWEPRNKGLSATFLPNPDVEVGHDPHFVDFCLSQPDVLWQQNHCGVFRSVDGGATWSDISQKEGPVGFGFAIAADASDPNTAWVVPADSDERRLAHGGSLFVCRTDDGGATWKELRNGLPQENCFDIVFRHALGASGDTIVFGSTTGNAFVSEDRGESWSCLGNYLPPIYSTRFASGL
jgi:hypothetical protein